MSSISDTPVRKFKLRFLRLPLSNRAEIKPDKVPELTKEATHSNKEVESEAIIKCEYIFKNGNRCKYMTTRANIYKNHVQRHQQLVCKVCEVDFTRKHKLRRHMLTHNKELRPHQCKYCKRQYNRPDNRKRHEKYFCKFRNQSSNHSSNVW